MSFFTYINTEVESNEYKDTPSSVVLSNVYRIRITKLTKSNNLVIL